MTTLHTPTSDHIDHKSAHTFPALMKTMRQHYHMTQQDLANKTGLARATISRYELGQRSPSIEDTTTILTALHLELTITRDKSDF